MGFVQSNYDYSLFTQQKESSILIVLVYVDDLLVTGSNHKLIEQVRKYLQTKFKMKDLGELKYFLGIELARSEKEIHLCQRKYALELEMGLNDSKPYGTPLEFNHKINPVDYDTLFQPEVAEYDTVLSDKSSYQRIVGRLLYLTMTRPDLVLVCKFLVSICMHLSHLTWKLLRGWLDNGLGYFMPATSSMKLNAYCDSDWGSRVETRKSVIGYVVKFGDALIS
ncbi:uncharacterized mitochondrial protein AtMg00810-like [Lycium barbarum]|uniref:uncharacterized mitochondrial protein AtMg00810-like n=1 Tax=Lycium barbarum TaxID=112863 RepID=UPI00293F1415|nr:uncharacterized mitochondrial protein AtMg00810-like [Lycium barbarum]